MVEYNLYNNNISFKEMFKDTGDQFLKQQIKTMRDFNVTIIKKSDYNKLIKMQNKEEIDLKEEEALLLTDMASMKEGIKDFITRNDAININDNELKINAGYEYNPIETLPMSMNFLTIIVDDKYVDDMNIYKKYLSLNYKGNKIKTEESIISEFENLIKLNSRKSTS